MIESIKIRLGAARQRKQWQKNWRNCMGKGQETSEFQRVPEHGGEEEGLSARSNREVISRQDKLRILRPSPSAL